MQPCEQSAHLQGLSVSNFVSGVRGPLSRIRFMETNIFLLAWWRGHEGKKLEALNSLKRMVLE